MPPYFVVDLSLFIDIGDNMLIKHENIWLLMQIKA